tara:strand:- start:274 stop:420 length:147 start_codon:yes stop_codon:yes gene_type:complete
VNRKCKGGYRVDFKNSELTARAKRAGVLAEKRRKLKEESRTLCERKRF